MLSTIECSLTHCSPSVRPSARPSCPPGPGLTQFVWQTFVILYPRRRQSRGYGYQRRLSVCLSVFPHDISKTDAARITKLDVEMLHGESWNTIYFEVKRSMGKVTLYKNSVVSAGFL